MSDLRELAEKVVCFRDEREWKQFHNPKDLALSLSLEASELLEIFQWKEGPAIQQVAKDRQQEVADELADVLSYLLLMAHDTGIDLESALLSKLAANASRYPIEKARGSSKKYSDL
ncbi:nucleotide pyrophosphohydrolase [Caenimonas sedimenti]|uniref:Nucleotide pyrophosphohydrolase n=2 Tax=Caenimonas sedimenti TaxID=2596921 RepID=A0A562ZKA5_9BURK|nr:nucleotide pyrophosphohydrolase [Caenimonas sedimenti]